MWCHFPGLLVDTFINMVSALVMVLTIAITNLTGHNYVANCTPKMLTVKNRSVNIHHSMVCIINICVIWD